MPSNDKDHGVLWFFILFFILPLIIVLSHPTDPRCESARASVPAECLSEPSTYGGRIAP